MSYDRSKTLRPGSGPPAAASDVTQKMEAVGAGRGAVVHTAPGAGGADDATMQLTEDVLRQQHAADRAATARPAGSRRGRRERVHLTPDATTDFEIPAEWIEPIAPGELGDEPSDEPVGNNRVRVFDPYAEPGAPAGAARRAQPAARGKLTAPRTMKMSVARSQALARVSLEDGPLEDGSQTLGAGFSFTELRDLDAEGFHVLVARVDSHGRVVLPEDIFGAGGLQPGALVLLKVRVMQEQHP